MTGLVELPPVTTTEIVPTTLPVDGVVDTWRTIMRLVLPVRAGDRLDISSQFDVTNDVGKNRGDAGYTVGVGTHLWWYDVDLPAEERVWRRVHDSTGDNVDRGRHHMPIVLDDILDVPPDWPEGHRITIALRADAHSTAWQAGDVLTVESTGRLTVRRWTAAPPPEPAPSAT
ncbi:hypothetical protein NLX86_06715 [Streptomyces sp. A3M-1-3]|uniref:hypothetical protein n=1 Tax=Streptomyces sp. A3M-1-3 TaxID=2962044 RepID=UPI0020B890FB|nr:hypothetical protein [Streptomyces sp. A3M-1-3]MCP3817839.1 hypothetical protein [Streptomyces sp. A3M-1-3]